MTHIVDRDDDLDKIDTSSPIGWDTFSTWIFPVLHLLGASRTESFLNRIHVMWSSEYEGETCMQYEEDGTAVEYTGSGWGGKASADVPEDFSGASIPFNKVSLLTGSYSHCSCNGANTTFQEDDDEARGMELIHYITNWDIASSQLNARPVIMLDNCIRECDANCFHEDGKSDKNLNSCSRCSDICGHKMCLKKSDFYCSVLSDLTEGIIVSGHIPQEEISQMVADAYSAYTEKNETVSPRFARIMTVFGRLLKGS